MWYPTKNKVGRLLSHTKNKDSSGNSWKQFAMMVRQSKAWSAEKSYFTATYISSTGLQFHYDDPELMNKHS